MYLQSKDLNLEELNDLVKKFKTDDFKYIMQGLLNEFQFEYFRPELIKASELESLNIFSNSGEFKVRKIDDDLYRCVYLGEKDLNLGLEDFSTELKFSESKEIFTILWGENKLGQDYFVEQTIPHYFKYPVDLRPSKEKQRVILKQILYFSPKGNSEFIRNYDLEVKTEEELCQ